MDADALEAAAELCRLAGTGDLLSWLGLTPGVSADEAREALGRERKRMQSMQANPKYKDVARHLLKTWRKIEVVLGEPEAYLQALGEREVSARLPLLQLAIDGVLADGVLTSDEEAFVREQALALGIEVHQYERLLHERCAALGVALPTVRDPTPAPPVFATVEGDTGVTARPTRPVPEGTGWWDDAFTRVLLEQVPPETTRTIDLACGLGVAAVVLLRERSRMEYLGIDPNPLHVDVARRNLEQAGLGGRAVFQQLDPSRPLPLPDGVLDLALCVMSLHHFPDTRPVLREAARLVRPGGRLVAVEPDTTAQQFWFDGNLRAFNHLFQGLCERADRVRRASGTDDPLGQPGVALGPELGRRMAEAGLRPVTTVVHPVQVDHPCAFPSFARRLRRRIEAMRDAAGLSPADPLVSAAAAEIDRLEGECDPHRIGTAVHVLPVFVVVGVK